MKTFRFYFTWSDGKKDEIEFCSKTKKEALDLFYEWCKTDMHKDMYKIASIDECIEVYNKDDADEYGSDYEMGDMID